MLSSWQRTILTIYNNSTGFKLPSMAVSSLTHIYCIACYFNMKLMWRWELIEWLMRSWNWSVKVCQLTDTESTMNGWMITRRPCDCRWFYCTLKLNNGLINEHLTLEAFTVIHILKSFPQLKCEICSLLQAGRLSTSVYQVCQLIKSTFFNRGLS